MNFSKISVFAALIGSGIVGFGAIPAMAATFATDVFDTNGVSLKGQDRNVPGKTEDRYFYDNALTGVDDGDFYSLDFGETVIFEFGGTKFNSFKLWEVTFDGRENWVERVEISVGNNLGDLSSFKLVKDITNDIDTYGYMNVGGDYQYLMITDTTDQTVIEDLNAEEGVNLDGFDIDAIAVKYIEVPEPTSILGLLAASSFGAAVVRKRQQNLG